MTKCHRLWAAICKRALAFPKSFRTTFSPCCCFFFYFFPSLPSFLYLFSSLSLHPSIRQPSPFGCSFHSTLRFPLLSQPRPPALRFQTVPRPKQPVDAGSSSQAATHIYTCWVVVLASTSKRLACVCGVVLCVCVQVHLKRPIHCAYGGEDPKRQRRISYRFPAHISENSLEEKQF